MRRGTRIDHYRIVERIGTTVFLVEDETSGRRGALQMLRGEGLHHIKLFYNDRQQAIMNYAARGYPVIQCGRIDEDEHYYLDTEKDYGYILELGTAGKIRPGVRRFPA